MGGFRGPLGLILRSRNWAAKYVPPPEPAVGEISASAAFAGGVSARASHRGGVSLRQAFAGVVGAGRTFSGSIEVEGETP